ncbi:MAG: DUF3795 domain-containing protein [Chloroflexota bacterium]|nr:DUF3795 domain-containing protein [Chloroflexota bacterium]
MEKKIIAYCGLICSDCPAYIATQANDQEALEKVAAQWREEYDAPNMTVKSILCDGCLDGPRKCGHCAECEIRACAVAKGVLNCAHCNDYACEKLTGFFDFVPDAKVVLDSIRQNL